MSLIFSVLQHHRPENLILISALYLYSISRQMNSTFRWIDEQQSDSIRFPFVPFEVRKPEKNQKFYKISTRVEQLQNKKKAPYTRTRKLAYSALSCAFAAWHTFLLLCNDNKKRLALISQLPLRHILECYFVVGKKGFLMEVTGLISFCFKCLSIYFGISVCIYFRPVVAQRHEVWL